MLPVAGRPKRLARYAAAAAVVAGVLLAPAAAAGRTITVGSPLTGAFAGNWTFISSSTVTVANTALADPDATVFSPVDGVVRRWRLVPQGAADTYALRVLRPTGVGTYTGVGTSSPVIASTTEMKTSTTNLPVRAGDLIGLEALRTTPSFRVTFATPVMQSFWREPDLADGATLPPTPSGIAVELGYNAQVEPAPRVTLIAPASGSPAGGTSVTIAGRDFSGATSVNFGATPAASFVVDSDLQITAIAPAATAPGPVDVSVTAAAGTSPAVAGDQFTYVAPNPPPPAPTPTPCAAPNLVGKKLVAARKALAKTKCKLGKITGERGKTAKVVKQNPKPGTVRTPGSTVSVKLG